MRAYGEALPSLPLSYAKIVRKDRTFYDPADRKKKQTIRRVRQEYGLILPFRSVGNEHKEQTVMSVLTFDKKELGNLEYSLQREMLATDRRGGYMSTTIVCCNTRKYHGLMVAPIDDSDRAYVLLSSVDETVVHDGQSFNLALHRFPGTYEPRGHKYITDFEYTPTPTITYRVGSIVLRKELLAAYRRGVGGVAVHDNGLVWASAPDKALTWMNALAGGVPVVSRDGYPVEINALWYNAVCYALELASRFGEEEFVGEWKAWPERIRNAFREMFWSGDDGYLADFVGPEGPNRWIRPNMVVACGLDYKMLDEEQQASVLRIVGQHLLTPKGLRSLSPRNPRYKNRCEGDEAVRAEASMNGSVWVWPLWFYVKASFDLGGREFLPRAEELLARFGEEIQSYGIGSINELFDGDPPHAPWGAVSQAWSVGAVLMIRETTERWRRRRGHGLLPGLRKKR